MSSNEHMNFYTIFQGAQLLQRLSALQRALFPLNKLEERIPAKSVDTLMAQVANAGRFGGVGDNASREVGF